MVNYPNYYPVAYPNYPPQAQQIPNQQPMTQPVQQMQSGQMFVWVQSEKEAMDYPLSAGQSLFLMNQNDNYLYAKSVDQLGKSTFLKKRLVDESDNREPTVDLSEYIRREEIENLISDKIQREVEKRVSEISFKPTKTKKQVIVDEED